MQLYDFIQLVLGWPLMIYVVATSIFCTVLLRFIQITAFVAAFKKVLFPKKTYAVGDMSPVQAFINTLNASIGNGSIAGMATAIYSGGPGSAFWVVFFGLLMMSVRFVEVYISTEMQKNATTKSVLGGPMLYLKNVAGGHVLSYIYAAFCFFFGLSVGNAMQSNSVALSVSTSWGISPFIISGLLFVLVLYILFGGADRIVKFSSAIVPIKVGVFLISSIILLCYHWAAIIPALILICKSAFSYTAISGGATGFAIQQAIRFGMARSIMATESGLGTAAILFGFTGSKDPLESGYLGMIGTFISTIVCFLVALCIIVSGVWDSGLNSTALTVTAYSTVFGALGGWIITFLSVTFGVGVLVTYAYITRAAFLMLTNGRFELLFMAIYSACTALGALVSVNLIWTIGDVVNAGMLFINLYGLVVLLPKYTGRIFSKT